MNSGLNVFAENGADIYFRNALGLDKNQRTGLVNPGQGNGQVDTDNHRQTERNDDQPAALENQVTEIGSDASPVLVRATRTLGAYYLEPIHPGATVNLIAKKLEFDGFLARIIGQAVVDNKICCVAVGEGYLV